MMHYIDTRRSQGRRPFIDGPHFELRYWLKDILWKNLLTLLNKKKWVVPWQHRI
jgi:hypothetical protein